MARRRFFVDGFRKGQAEIAGDEAHHLTRVLRVEKGHRYEVSDNQSAWLAEVTEAHKSRVTFTLLEPVASSPLPVRLTLAASLIKFDHFEWLLEKGTELGVERFIPVIADRSEKGLDRAVPKRAERWRRILIESSQQCRRDRLPELAEAAPFREALGEAGDVRIRLEEERGARYLSRVAPEAKSAADRVVLLTGPEGGWTDREREQASGAGWLAATLGPQILRAETAAITGVAVVVNLWGAALEATGP
ncbi:MAG: RsmE family RNA methyltransferase [Bryobacteraceae bacterium]